MGCHCAFKPLYIRIWRCFMQLYVVLTLIFAILITLFAIFNAEVILVNFLFAEVDMPLALVIIGSALVGAIAMLIFDTFRRIKSGKNIKDLKKQLDSHQKIMQEKDGKITQVENALNQCETTVKNQQDLIDALKAEKTEKIEPETTNTSEMVTE